MYFLETFSHVKHLGLGDYLLYGLRYKDAASALAQATMMLFINSHSTFI